MCSWGQKVQRALLVHVSGRFSCLPTALGQIHRNRRKKNPPWKLGLVWMQWVKWNIWSLHLQRKWMSDSYSIINHIKCISTVRITKWIIFMPCHPHIRVTRRHVVCGFADTETTALSLHLHAPSVHLLFILSYSSPCLTHPSCSHHTAPKRQCS